MSKKMTTKLPNGLSIYYSPATYALIVLLVLAAPHILGPFLGDLGRTLKGLPEYNPEGFDGMLLGIAFNIGVYVVLIYSAIIAVIIQSKKISLDTRKAYQNIGIGFTVLLSCSVTALYISLYLNAPVDGYPQFNF